MKIERKAHLPSHPYFHKTLNRTLHMKAYSQRKQTHLFLATINNFDQRSSAEDTFNHTLTS